MNPDNSTNIHVHLVADSVGELARQARKLVNDLERATGGPDKVSGSAPGKELTDIAQKGELKTATEATASGKKATTAAGKKAAPEKEPATEQAAEQQAPTKGPSVDDVKAAVRNFLGTYDSNTEGQAAAGKLLLDEFGVGKVGSLDEEHFADAIKLFEDETAARADADE